MCTYIHVHLFYFKDEDTKFSIQPMLASWVSFPQLLDNPQPGRLKTGAALADILPLRSKIILPPLSRDAFLPISLLLCFTKRHCQGWQNQCSIPEISNVPSNCPDFPGMLPELQKPCCLLIRPPNALIFPSCATAELGEEDEPVRLLLQRNIPLPLHGHRWPSPLGSSTSLQKTHRLQKELTRVHDSFPEQRRSCRPRCQPETTNPSSLCESGVSLFRALPLPLRLHVPAVLATRDYISRRATRGWVEPGREGAGVEVPRRQRERRSCSSCGKSFVEPRL